jgi:phosphocarrier protein
MLTDSLRVVNPLGLHARAAAVLVRITAKYGSTIILARTDRDISANAKSILSVLALAAATGTELKISVEGPDEEAALESIRELFSNGFGEIK